jgi:Protein of unknown function (DUF2971)
LAKRTDSSPAKKRLCEHLKPMLAGTAPDNMPALFVACLSAAPNSLNQWRAYGQGEGGFSLGFASAALRKSVAPIKAYLAPVMYTKTTQESLVHELLEWSLEEYERNAPAHLACDTMNHLENWTNALFARAAFIWPLMKDEAFEEELEWRIVYSATRRAEVKFIPKPNALSPYVDLNLRRVQSLPGAGPTVTPTSARRFSDLLPLCQLWVGPGHLKDLSAVSAETLLINHGYTDVSIRKSTTPYRVLSN